MRLIIIIIIIAGLGYFGYQYYENNMAGEPEAEAVIEIETMVDESGEPLEEMTGELAEGGEEVSADMVENGEAVVEEPVEEGEAMADGAGDADAEVTDSEDE